MIFLKYLWKRFFLVLFFFFFSPAGVSFYQTKLKEQNVTGFILNLSDSIGTTQEMPDFVATIHRRRTTALQSPHLFLYKHGGFTPSEFYSALLYNTRFQKMALSSTRFLISGFKWLLYYLSAESLKHVGTICSQLKSDNASRLFPQ